MLVTESQIEQAERELLLEDMGVVKGNEFNTPYKIPVVCREDEHIVDLDELMEFAETNGITLGECIDIVCESHGIDDICVSIHEEDIIGDKDTEILAEALMEYGYKVYAKPLNENDYVSQLGDLVLEIADRYGNHEEMLSLFCEDAAEDEAYKASMEFANSWKKRGEKRLADIRSDFDGYYGLEDIFNRHHDVEERAKVYYDLWKRGIIDNGEMGPKSQERIYNMLKQGASLEEIRNSFGRRATSSAADFVFRNENNAYHVASLGGQDIKDKMQDRLYHYHKINFDIDNSGHFLNQKEARETEEGFNAAKKRELERLKYIGAQAGSQDVDGASDAKLQDRLNELSKMVENEKYPKSWLAKKIAWLRGLYRNIMMKWSIRKHQFNAVDSMSTAFYGDIANWYKRIAAWILRLIDKLLLKLQNAVA